ncbi:hypothetical protein [Pseudoblastomonas halimionae]|uniref:Lipoprotein n=1 Tax=Alteriqipengyuania halimionae TaxID=1926630 RepID=A0A6I4TYF7_9SPHN|nr:hypothetical protein [Alteriqipengyuania halimionae]MXP08648.1 hypothetical protein [Alteriqipengyuania halimionae]
MTITNRVLLLGASALALTGCEADQIVSPGTSGDINVDIDNPAPAPTPTPTSGTLVTPAAGCPTINSTGGLTDRGTISGPTGEYRRCELPSLIDADDTLTYVPGLLYELPGRVDIGADQGFSSTGSTVELTIQPGVTVYGATGRSFLVANRGNQLIANGTVDRPIVFTSRDNVLGLSTDDSTGQWGGVVLLGRAPVSDCYLGGFNTTAAPNNNPQCEQELEGTNTLTLFGGSNSADSSGSLSYVQIRYSGFSLAPGKELQSLTTGGVGSGTTFNHIMTFNSSDDGMEFFGGTVRMKYVAAIGADDDTVDVDTGAQADMQYVLGVQRSAGGDNLIELDSPDGDYSTAAIPQTRLRVSDFTFIQRSSSSSQVVRARGGAKLVLANGVLDTDDKTCIRIDETVTINADPDFLSLVGDCNAGQPFRGTSGATDAQVKAQFDADSTANVANFTLTLAAFINGSNENGVAVFDASTLSNWFDATANIGAVTSASDTWYRNWTCNSSIADFGSSNGFCTRLPVY